MTDKFRNKYRIPSARLKDWDYGSNAKYFITICTKNKVHSFGEVVDNLVLLNETGKICEQYLNDIPNHFPFVYIDSSIVMPNHLHSILVIDKPDFEENNSQSKSDVELSVFDLKSANNINEQKNKLMSSISPCLGSISTIVRSFKSAVTKEAHKIDSSFEWQSRFHDHIIRNEESYFRIKKYIENNPKNWKEDKFNK